ncbi:uncharacterized protein LOC109492740 isoform X4 [Felis catus]|uniref:uncharacterized protein LOC109492740 isoform X4 n=1 Tax=Felis catus TaxID=9685 RepID=UPI001D199233|nr:uncharacterized protein LOC109492740 isoform X4 [Felis catus]
MLGERAAQEAMAPALQARRRSAQPRRRHPTMPRAARESPRRARSCSGARRPDSPGTPHADAARAILTEGSRPLFPFLLRPGPPSSIGLGPKHSGPSDCRGFPVPTRKEDKGEEVQDSLGHMPLATAGKPEKSKVFQRRKSGPLCEMLLKSRMTGTETRPLNLSLWRSLMS